MEERKLTFVDKFVLWLIVYMGSLWNAMGIALRFENYRRNE